MEQEIELECQKAISGLEAMRSYTRFDFGETNVGYYCDDADSVEWLCHFFAGYFVPRMISSANANVYSTCNPALLALLQTSLSHSLPLNKEEYREIALDPQSILIHKRTKATPTSEGIYYYLHKPGRKLLIVSSGDPRVRREQELATIRALMKMLLIERGWLPLHAACCTKDGQGICIVGSKFAGKTSTLINLLARNGFHLVASDKLLLYDAGAQVLACGLPGKAGIRLDTVLCHPPLLHWLGKTTSPSFPHINVESIDEIAATTGGENLTMRKEKIHLLPAELTALFGVSIEAITPLKLFLFPIFDSSLQVSALVPLGEGKHRITSLMSNYLSPSRKGEGFLCHFFDASDEILKERLSSLLTRFLPDIPIYELYQSSHTNAHSALLVAEIVSQLKESNDMVEFASP
jgi:hypothetical protein